MGSFIDLSIIQTIDLEQLTTSDSPKELVSNESKLHVPVSISCRVAVGVMVYVIVAMTQIVFKKLVYEKYVQDKLHEFVDLCSVSNVSLSFT